MAMTIPQYAKSRHLSDKGVYKALDRHPEIKELLYIGKSNGKDAKMLSDDAIGMLDQVMRHPFQGLDDVQKDLQVYHSSELQQKDNVISGLKDKLIEEMGETRKEMIDAVGAAVSDSMTSNNEELKESLEKISNDNGDIKASIEGLRDNQATQYRILELQNQVEMLERENRALREQVQELKEDLREERSMSVMQRLFKKG